MANPKIYEAVEALLDSNESTPQWKIDKHLKTISSISSKHGVPADLFLNFLKFICSTAVISSKVKITMIKTCLVPDDYLSNEIFHFILTQLGNVRDHYLNKDVQCALCEWLINVYFLFPEKILDADKSILIYLWKYEYLQKYITYFIVWSTQSKQDIKLWKLNMLDKTAKKPVYSAAAVNLILILKRYLTILNDSDRLLNLLGDRNTIDKKASLQELQNLKFDKKFTSLLIKILPRESPNKFGIDVINERQEMLLDILKDSDTDSNILRFDNRRLRNTSSPLYDVLSIPQLSRRWTRLKLPTNVDPIFKGLHSNPVFQFYPMITANDSHYNDTTEQRISKSQFLYSLNSWVEINLKRCFNDITLLKEETQPIISNILFSCQIFEELQTTTINTFLTLENLLANEKIFVSLTTSLFPVLKPPYDSLPSFRNKVLKFLAICHLTYNDKKNHGGNSKVFPIMCTALISMIQNWFINYPTDRKVTDFGFIMLADIRKLILANMRFSIDDRFLSMTLIYLIANLTDIIPMYKTVSGGDPLHFDKLVLNSDSIHKMILSDDPLILNTCCKYLIKMTDVLINQPNAGKFIELQNQYILDITNYLWRNKVVDKKKIFNIPTEFIKQVLENCFFPDVKNKSKAVFSITGIPAMSFISIKALKLLERKHSVDRNYDKLLTEENFNAFNKSITREHISWIPNVSNFASLKILILREISSMEPYMGIAKFLFAFLKSLSKYNDAKE